MYGQRLFVKTGHNAEQFSYIRGKMRQVGRLVYELRTKKTLENCYLKDFIDPLQFRDVLNASKIVTGYDDERMRNVQKY